jgi:hypothetical protein
MTRVEATARVAGANSPLRRRSCRRHRAVSGTLGLRSAVVPQLPRVAVLGAGAAGIAALHGLVDGGLMAVAVDARPAGGPDLERTAPPEVAALLERYALAERVVPATEPPRVVALGRGPGAAAGRRPFEILAGAGGPGVADAIAVADPALVAAVPGGAGWADDLFLGVFPAAAEGLFGIALDPLTSATRTDGKVRTADMVRVADIVRTADIVRVAEARGRLLGEYLRGRYLPPPLPAAPPSRRGGPLGGLARRRHDRDPAGTFLRALERETRRGHARAAAAGYPLPLPRADVTDD